MTKISTANIHLRSPIAAVDAIVKARHGSWAYAKDNDFGALVMRDVVTYAQAKAFIATLEADRYAMEGNRHWKCSKARSAADSLAYWRKHMQDTSCTAGEFIASARRTCCGCHEQGSFALSSYYREAMARNHKANREKASKRVKKWLA